jgi:transcriptional regulator with XRE-family HTH domain
METRFAGWLGDAMRGRGLSQAELARHVGVADTQVSRWRRGQVVPNVHSLQRLADTFGVPRAALDRLVGYPVDPSESPSMDASDDDPELEAELRSHEARVRQILRERLPRSAWPAYLQACESLAAALAAGLSQAEAPSSVDAGPRGIGFGAR